MLKLTQKVFVLFFILTSALFYIGCQQEQSAITPDFNQFSLNKYSLPVGANLVSAELFIHISTPNNQTVKVRRITAPWDETTVTWSNFGGAYEGEYGSFVADNDLNADQYKVVNVLPLVQAWVNGTYSDYGLLLDQVDQNYPRAVYHSRTNTIPPKLRLGYSIGGGTTQYIDLSAIADAYIWQYHPTTNYNNTWLYTGWLSATDKEKQALLKFDIEPTPDGGCTYTIGYWKTHSEFGPAPYDATWAQLPNGASTTFFLSGQSYYAVFNTAPAGNPYYQLAHQYMGAVLNQLNGADLSSIQTQFATATALFNTYTPTQVASAPNSLKNQFRALIQPLTDYNEGTIGPGHCE